MELYKLLPIPKGTKEVSQWMFTFLLDVARESREVIEMDEPARLRERNERLSAYLPTLVVCLGATKQFMDGKRAEYVRANPKPEKGVTEWREAMDAELAGVKRISELIEGLLETIGQRLSITQSNLSSLKQETRTP